jgi:hypothetical protein
VVGLADQQRADINAEGHGVAEVQCVFDIDEQRGPASLLRLSDHGKSESGLAGGLRPIDLGDAATR